MFGDTGSKRLKAALDDGKIAMQVGPMLGAKATEVAIQNIGRDILAAAMRMHAAERTSEAVDLISAARVGANNAWLGGAENAWNQILDFVVEEMA